jgi:hypothetical protein
VRRRVINEEVTMPSETQAGPTADPAAEAIAAEPTQPAPSGEPAPASAAPPPTSADPALLALAREALIAANPDAVPELIAGATAEELRASLTGARAAGTRARAAAAAVPAGAPARTESINLEAMTPEARIHYALRQRDARA